MAPGGSRRRAQLGPKAGPQSWKGRSHWQWSRRKTKALRGHVGHGGASPRHWLGCCRGSSGVALIPLDAKLESGDQALAHTLASVATQEYLTALLAVLGGVLLVAFFGVLTRLV